MGICRTNFLFRPHSGCLSGAIVNKRRISLVKSALFLVCLSASMFLGPAIGEAATHTHHHHHTISHHHESRTHHRSHHRARHSRRRLSRRAHAHSASSSLRATVATASQPSASAERAAPRGGVIVRASYYSSGRRTASGEPFRAGGFTAAHRSLPFGTRLRLTNTHNGRTVTVRVNDRGPFVRGRSLDVSRGAAVALGMIGSGTATLRMARL